jgi:maltose alpha-D-glucosyltransferase / alpha-amylase
LTVSTWIDRLIDELRHHARERLGDVIGRQRWFGAKGRPIAAIGLLDHAVVADDRAPVVLVLLQVASEGGGAACYLLPLLIRPQSRQQGDEPPLTTIEAPEGVVGVWDATADRAACLLLLKGIQQQQRWTSRAGVFVCTVISSGDQVPATIEQVKRLSAEQSNTSIVYDRRFLLKLIRRLEPGINPDCEVLEFLTTRTAYRHVPALLGSITYEGPLPDHGTRSAVVGMLQTFVANDGDGWTWTVGHVRQLAARPYGQITSLEEAKTVIRSEDQEFLRTMRRLGGITAELHHALAGDSDNLAFAPEPITGQDVARWTDALVNEIRTTMNLLKGPALGIFTELVPECAPEEWEAYCLCMLESLSLLPAESVDKIRIHGDYHLGQVLRTSSEDFTILDFEGEPARPLADRRAKHCALKDVAGLVRSVDYATHAARQATREPDDRHLVEAWKQETVGAILMGYTEVAPPGQVNFLPRSADSFRRVLETFQLEKVFYELRYEYHHRPDWLAIPLRGLVALLQPYFSRSA